MTSRVKMVGMIGLLALSAAFVAWGAARGEAMVVLQRAVSICLECIGVG